MFILFILFILLMLLFIVYTVCVNLLGIHLGGVTDMYEIRTTIQRFVWMQLKKRMSLSELQIG